MNALLDVNGMPNPYSEATLDPTAAACRKPWQPMTPEQLDALRPQNKVTAPETPAQEARRIAYQSGVQALEGLVLRLQALERELADLKLKVDPEPSGEPSVA